MADKLGGCSADCWVASTEHEMAVMLAEQKAEKKAALSANNLAGSTVALWAVCLAAMWVFCWVDQ